MSLLQWIIIFGQIIFIIFGLAMLGMAFWILCDVLWGIAELIPNVLRWHS